MTKEASDDYFRRLVDRESLRDYFINQFGSEEELAVEHLQEGHSNETLIVRWGDRDLVLRRPPPGETADTAHDVLREFRVIDALQGTDVPVPPTVLSCDDPSVLGCHFYVMDYVEGHVLRGEEPDEFSTHAARETIGIELVDTLARIHSVEYDTIGLDDFGYPDGFTGRQVERWQQQFEWAFEVTTDARSIPAVTEIGEWLDANLPTDHPQTLVHGDYKLDNVMFGPEAPPEIVSVFDWELSTLGDPRTDLGWLLLFWHDQGDPDPAIPELQASFMARPGYLSKRDLVNRYEQQTGIEFTNGRFYRVLAAFKLAALGEMFYRRYLEGNSDDSLYPIMETRVPALIDHAVMIMDDEVGL